MLNYAVLSKKPTVFRNFSGLELTEFDALTLKLNEKYPAFEQKRLSRIDRKRQIGAGHPFKLSLADRFLMLLMYSHLYVSSTLLAVPIRPHPNQRAKRHPKVRVTSM